MIATLNKRLAQTSDLPGLTELLADAQRQMQQAGITQWNPRYPNPETLQADIDQQLLWLYGRQQHAAITLTLADNTLQLHRLMVHSECRGRGLATQILQDLIAVAASRDLTGLQITTNHTNRPMMHLLEKADFQLTREFLVPDRTAYGAFYEYNYALN